jgi:hypothetical protein
LSSLQEEEEEEDKLRFRSVRMMDDASLKTLAQKLLVFFARRRRRRQAQIQIRKDDVLLCRISEAYILSGQGENPATETYHVFTSKEYAGPMAHRLPNKAHNQKRRGAS